MKRSNLFLAASVVANLAIGGYVWREFGASVSSSQASSGAVRSSRTVPPSVSSPAGPTGTGSAGAAAYPADLRLPATKWKELMTGDLTELVQRLRAAGIPAGRLGGIVNVAVRDQFADRYKAAFGIKDEIPPYWQELPESMSWMTIDPAVRLAQQKVQQEMRNMQRDLLGDDSFAGTFLPENQAMRISQYGDLSDEKVLGLLKLTSEYARMTEDFYMSMSGPTPEERLKIDEVNKKRRAAIEAFLTPEELREYDLRSGPNAMMLRSQLGAFDPSEEEYRLIYNLRKAFDDANPPIPNATLAQNRERSAKLTAYQEQIAASFSPERGREYLVSLEPGAAQVGRLVTRLGLPAATVSEVIAVQRETQVRLAGRGNSPGAGADPAIAAIGADAAAQLSQILGGTRGLEGYKLNGGYWLNNILPPPPPLDNPANR